MTACAVQDGSSTPICPKIVEGRNGGGASGDGSGCAENGGCNDAPIGTEELGPVLDFGHEVGGDLELADIIPAGSRL